MTSCSWFDQSTAVVKLQFDQSQQERVELHTRTDGGFRVQRAR